MNIAQVTSESEGLASLMQALASPVRLRILGMLARKSLCVKAIAADLAASQPAVSQHLRVLRQAGLVAAHRSGYFVHYRLDRLALSDCQERLAKLAEGSEPDAAGSGSCPQDGCLHGEVNP